MDGLLVIQLVSMVMTFFIGLMLALSRVHIDKPEATVEAIAEDCGFTSRSYFQNLFKAETGFTPREWRWKMNGSA